MSKWFVNENHQISGPYTTDQIKIKLKEGLLGSGSTIWGHAHENWIKASQWTVKVAELKEALIQKEDKWYFAKNNKKHGPFNKDELKKQLKEQAKLTNILLWTTGMKSWSPFYSFKDLVDEMGIDSRRFPRVDIEGKTTISVNNNSAIAVLKSISEGGIGIEGINSLNPGEVVNIDIHSKALPERVIGTASVRYVSKQGFVGLEFVELNSVSKAIIIEYVKRTLKNNSNKDTEKAAA